MNFQMNEWIALLGPLLGGVFLGLLFFGGLWLTIKYAVKARNAGPWFVLSMLLRTALVLAGFYLIAQGEFAAFLACLLGFILSRMMVIKKIRSLKTVTRND